jgi:hypothetical protein
MKKCKNNFHSPCFWTNIFFRILSCFLIVLICEFSFGHWSKNIKTKAPQINDNKNCTNIEIITPGPKNTGFRGAGITIKDLKKSGPIFIKQEGTVIEKVDINGRVEVYAKNAIIRNSRISSMDYWPVRIFPGGSLTIEYTEIIGIPASEGAITTDNYTARYLNVHGTSDGLRGGENIIIEYCYIHDLAVSKGSHNDGIQISAGGNVIIRNNVIEVPRGSTSAILIETDFGPIDNILIDNNILDGGAYTIYSRIGNYRPRTPPTNVRITNNRFGRSYHYGLFSIDGAVHFNNNIWHDSGKAVEHH